MAIISTALIANLNLKFSIVYSMTRRKLNRLLKYCVRKCLEYRRELVLQFLIFPYTGKSRITVWECLMFKLFIVTQYSQITVVNISESENSNDKCKVFDFVFAFQTRA